MSRYQHSSVLEVEACLGGTTSSLPHFHLKGVKNRWRGNVKIYSAVEQSEINKVRELHIYSEEDSLG